MDLIAWPIETARRCEVKRLNPFAAAISVVVLIGLGIWLWLFRTPAVPPQPTAVVAAVTADVAPSAPALPTVPERVIQYPIASPDADASAIKPVSIEAALMDLFGRKAVLGLFQLDGFANRVAATVDNLGRMHAPARLWPLSPAQGRFTVAGKGDAEVIGADNGLRYAPYVLMFENVDLRQAVAVYTRLYPQFQQAYEELGYPKGYFNDRVVEVIDHLLATPDATSPLKVRLPTIKSPVQPPRPWILYEFEDPALESLSAGQKILLRMGPVNERRMKARLAELRRLVAGNAAPR
ncbi:MAG: DUF3014 domain-containing protein [Burkholderiaceae bacterium]